MSTDYQQASQQPISTDEFIRSCSDNEIILRLCSYASAIRTNPAFTNLLIQYCAEADRRGITLNYMVNA